MSTLASIDRLGVFYEPENGQRIRVGTLGRRGRQILFQYDAAFLARRLDISPLRLPLRPDVFEGDPNVFAGLMGVFEDSLPHGWGRLLLQRLMAKRGVSFEAPGPLDRLAWVGGRAMGALVYEPEMDLEEPTIVSLAEVEDEVADLQGASAEALERLVALESRTAKRLLHEAERLHAGSRLQPLG